MNEEQQIIAIWLTDPYAACWAMTEEQASRLQKLLPERRVVLCETDAAFLDSLPAAETAITWRFEQAWFARSPLLRRIVTPAAGREGVNIQPPDGVEVWTSGFHGELMAETVLALILAHYRGIIARVRYADDPWPRSALGRVMRPLRGQRVTILGYGHIGAWIARLLAPFGVRITGIRRHPERRESIPGVDVTCLGMDRLDVTLERTDVLIMSLPGGAETNDLMNTERLARLPANAIVINVGRGNAIDEEGLVAALRAGRLAAAYLDVAKAEPVPAGSPLLDCPRLFLMPHVSAIAPNYLDLFCDEFAKRMKVLT